MDKAKKRQRKYSFNFTAKSAMQQLKSGLLSIFWCQIQEDRSTGRAESSGCSKRGHFSVVVLENGEHKKFFVALRYLRYPPFIKLLDAAEQEYGFNQPGAIVIPCGESELENILSEKLKS
ncbi:hypothetical protein DITRI_Ditri06bG0059300 [Diplodiscus trichospermus]